jgi:hypothetical protein
LANTLGHPRAPSIADGRYREYLKKFREADVNISNYDPEPVAVPSAAS